MNKILDNTLDVTSSDTWKIVSITQNSPNTKTLRLSAYSKKMKFKFIPGQYVDITADIDGKLVNRPYSISSSASCRGYIDITIKREQDGYLSKYLNDQAAQGDLLQVRGPFGDFHFNGRKHKDVILLGAGVGVTPLVSMLRSLKDKKWRGRICAFFGYRDVANGLFVEELNELAENWPNFKLYLTYSSPSQNGVKYKGRLSTEFIESHIQSIHKQVFFCCGPEAMMNELQNGLALQGVKPNNFHVESFATAALDISKGGEFAISFPSAGVMVTSKPGETILATAERTGVRIDNSCKTGTCLLCQTKLVEGTIEMEAIDALDEDEIEQGEILTCQSFPQSSCRIVT